MAGTRNALKSTRPDSSAILPDLGVHTAGATTVKGVRRVGEILKAALDTLSRHGHSGLTLEAVAHKVGIQKGNLQYYFPTRADLLRAVFAEQITSHAKDWLAARGGPNTDPRERLRNLVAFELAMNRDENFVAQIRERWSFEARDREARRLTNIWYDWVSTRYADLIGEIRPDLDTETRHHLAMAVYSMVVGATPFFGEMPPAAEWSGGFGKALEEAVMRLVLAAD